MTTDEFIESVNALSEEERESLKALDTDRGVEIVYGNSYHTLAYLPHYTKRWIFIVDGYTFHGSVLKLMGELADSKYYEREKKYVILNGKPVDGCWDVFTICKKYNNLDEIPRVDLHNLVGNKSYTKDELAEAKKYLPEALQKAVDALTVPLSEALEMGEDNDN